MAIVAKERRGEALATMRATHEHIHAAMQDLDALQAEQENLEVTLGLAPESIVDTRESYRVLHFPEGTKGEGHSLDRCPDLGCDAETEDLEEELGGDAAGEGDKPDTEETT